jgi:hypothetical protein
MGGVGQILLEWIGREPMDELAREGVRRRVEGYSISPPTCVR